MANKLINKLNSLLLNALMLFLMTTGLSFAEIDPATRASARMSSIMFGQFGTSISAIIIGATFIMAKTGKITWDRFVFIGFCTAGFLGARSIVSIINGWVN